MALAVGLSAYAGAKIEWVDTTHNFGAFNESMGAVTARFAYTNIGDEDLVITDARANCGCTRPEYSADVLHPGDTAWLSVTYDPGGRPGRFEKKVYVDTNSDNPRSTLTIKGVVVGSSTTISGRYPVEVGSLRLAHPAALLGAMTRGTVKSVFESGYNASTDTLRPVITDVPAWVEVKALPEVVPPGEQVSFNFFVHSDKVPEWDLVVDTVTIRPDASSAEVLRMPVVITVNEDFSKLTERQMADAPVAGIDRARLDPVIAGENGAQAFFSISNPGNSPLRLRRIYTRTPGVKIDYKPDETVKPGKSRCIKVTLSPEFARNTKATAVVMTIITNDPYNPKTTVTFPVTTEN